MPVMPCLFRVRVMLSQQRNSCTIANPPNNAQPGGTSYHSPKLHPGPCSTAGMRQRTETETHRRAWPIYIRLTQSVTSSYVDETEFCVIRLIHCHQTPDQEQSTILLTGTTHCWVYCCGCYLHGLLNWSSCSQSLQVWPRPQQALWAAELQQTFSYRPHALIVKPYDRTQ